MHTNASIDDKARAGLVTSAFGAISIFKIYKSNVEKVVDGGKSLKKSVENKIGDSYMKSHISPNIRY